MMVYRYGLTAPIEGADVVRDQIGRAHKYRNALVQIERERRAAMRAAESASNTDIAVLEADVTQADEQCELAAKPIKSARAQSRKRGETADMRAALKDARERKLEAVRALRARRAQLRSRCADCRRSGIEDDPCPHASPESIALRDAIDAIGERASERVRAAREASGLFWGTYLIVEDAAKRSFSDTPLYALDGTAPLDPRFARWTGDGAVGMQLQRGAGKPPRDLNQLTSSRDSRIKITLPEEGAWTHPSWGERRRRARTGQLAMRVGKDSEWAAWRMDMHRPLPEDADITWVVVHVEQVGPHSRWYVTFTVDAERQARSDASARSKSGVVAVDIGWRLLRNDQALDELRVCGWRAEGCDAPGVVVRANELLRAAGDPARKKTDAPYTLPPAGELRLDAETVRVLRAPEEIRGLRDLNLDIEKHRIGLWLARAPIPDWLREAAASVAQWRSAARLVSLYRKWSEARVRDDQTVFESLRAWTIADRALWEQESARRDWALRRRREVYRVFAVALARAYDTIIIEQFDLRKMAACPDVMSEEKINETARSNRQLVALSDLRGGPNSGGTFQQACRAHGANLAAVPAGCTTSTCPSCGLVDDRDAAAGARLVCECGHAWDQDIDGAPIVMLARWRERPSDAKVLVGARNSGKENGIADKQGSRWQRAARLRKQKEARMSAARKAGGNSAE